MSTSTSKGEKKVMKEICAYCGREISATLMSATAYERHYSAECQEDGKIEIVSFPVHL